MYTEEELNSKKYGELLKILKKLGIKGARQKTGRVIELILQNQNKEPETDKVSTPSSKTNTQNEKTEENETSTILYSAENAYHPLEFLQASPQSENKACHMLSNPNRRRTRTFIISTVKENGDTDIIEKDTGEKERKRSKGEKSLLEVSAVEESILSISGCLSRSSTFILDYDLPNDSLTESLDVKCSLDTPSTCAPDTNKIKERNNEQDGFPYSNVDLSCKEIETAEDIEGMESGKVSTSSPVNTRCRRTMRRSLRGQLLESKIYPLESFAPSLSAPVENPAAELNEGSNVCDQQSSVPFEPNFSIPKSFDFIKDTSTAQKGSNSKSSIPRFVSYARKPKMPNFAKIHENAFNKMEALDAYVERKHARTLSLADTKTPIIKGKTIQLRKGRELSSVKKNNIEKKVNKETPGKKLAEQASCSSSTRSSSTLASLTKNTSAQNGLEPSFNMGNRLRRTSSTPIKRTSRSSLVKENFPPKSPSNTWNKPKTPCDTPGSLNRRKSYVPSFSKPNVKIDENKSSAILKTKHQATQGGKLDNSLSRRELLKKAVKKPKVKSSAEIRATEKVFIKGVRTNRRFELQMAKRGIAPI